MVSHSLGLPWHLVFRYALYLHCGYTLGEDLACKALCMCVPCFPLGHAGRQGVQCCLIGPLI